MYLRPLLPQDRDSLAALIERIATFTAEEKTVARELIDDAVANFGHSHYRVIVAFADAEAETETVAGYICYGPTPMTKHTFDLYWIVADPDRRQAGVGRQLLAAMEETLRQQGGRVVRVETSSQETYGGVLRFYERTNFVLAGRIPQFYHDNDDLLIFYKLLEPAG
jgi:ribosomal protein S18 acetylase RimI-like enzyme